MDIDYSGGPLSGDGPGTSRFRRWDTIRPRFNFDISVFPHDKPKSLSRFINELPQRKGFSLTRDWESEKISNVITSIDPWANMYSDRPDGDYRNATGITRYAWRKWQVKDTNCQVDISYVSWEFHEAADCSTSIIARLEPHYDREAVIQYAAGEIKDLLRAMEVWLKSLRVNPSQVLARQKAETYVCPLPPNPAAVNPAPAPVPPPIVPKHTRLVPVRVELPEDDD